MSLLLLLSLRFPYVGGNCTHVIYGQGQQRDVLRTPKRKLDMFFLQLYIASSFENLGEKSYPKGSPTQQPK
jgi:hypothetical protein